MSHIAAFPSSTVRLLSGDAGILFQRLDGEGLLRGGSVTLVGVHRIRDGMGDRWERRREAVWGQLKSCAARRLTEADVCQRISDVDFVIALASAGRAQAQLTSLQILSETLLFFLGDCGPDDFVIRSVRDFNGREISCTPLAASDIAAAARVQAAPASGPAEPAKTPVIMIEAGPRPLSVSHVVESVVQLKSGKPAAFCCEPKVTDVRSGAPIASVARETLTDQELLLIDEATVDAATRLVATAPVGRRAALVLPISFRTLSGTRSRSRIHARIAAQDLGPYLFICINDVLPGTPPGRMSEIAALTNGLCTAVFARITPLRNAIAPLRDCRLQGVVLDVEPLSFAPAKIAEALLGFGGRARGTAPVLAARGLPSDLFLSAAELAGLTHASVAAAWVPPSLA